MLHDTTLFDTQLLHMSSEFTQPATFSETTCLRVLADNSTSSTQKLDIQISLCMLMFYDDVFDHRPLLGLHPPVDLTKQLLRSITLL